MTLPQGIPTPEAGPPSQLTPPEERKKCLEVVLEFLANLGIAVTRATVLLARFSCGLVVFLVFSAYFIFVVTGQSDWAKRVSDPITQLLELITKNWQGVLVLMIPFFHKELRSLMDRFEEGFGLKARAGAGDMKDKRSPP